MRFLTTLASLACVSFAAGAVAKTYTPQNADKYAEERGFPGLEDPAEQAAEVQAREADVPDYEAFAQKHGHYVREAMPMPDEVKGVVGGGEGDEVPGFDDDEEVDMSLEGYEDAHQNLVARSAEPEFESLEGVDTSLEGYEEAHQDLVARSAEPESEGLEGVDTSLEGYESEDDEDDDEEDDDEPSLHARDVQEDEDDEEDAYADGDDDDEDDLEDEDHQLVARSLQDEGVDTSLEGYGDMDEADDDNNGDTDDDDDEADDEASIQARSVPFRKQGWTKPNMASAVKSAWGTYATKGGARKLSHGGAAAGQHRPHHAREAAPEPEPEAQPEAEADPARRMGGGKGHHAHAGHSHASHASRPGNKPTGSKTSWAQKPTGTKKAGRGGWGFPW